jgi:hypothetical protein
VVSIFDIQLPSKHAIGIQEFLQCVYHYLVAGDRVVLGAVVASNDELPNALSPNSIEVRL